MLEEFLTDPKCRHVTQIILDGGMVLLLHYQMPMPYEDIERVQRLITDHLPPGVRALVLDSRIEISVIRHEEHV